MQVRRWPIYIALLSAATMAAATIFNVGGKWLFTTALLSFCTAAITACNDAGLWYDRYNRRLHQEGRTTTIARHS
jgi:hypothetical protein